MPDQNPGFSTEERTIRITTLRHAKTGLLVARSDEMPGLYVHGRTDDELAMRIPLAIKALLEASGRTVLDVSEIEEPLESFGFENPIRTFGARLEIS